MNGLQKFMRGDHWEDMRQRLNTVAEQAWTGANIRFGEGFIVTQAQGGGMAVDLDKGKTKGALPPSFLAKVTKVEGGPGEEEEDPDESCRITFESVEPVRVDGLVTFNDATPMQIKGTAYEVNGRRIPTGTVIRVDAAIFQDPQEADVADPLYFKGAGSEEYLEVGSEPWATFTVDIAAGTSVDGKGNDLTPLVLDGRTKVDPENETDVWTIEGQDTPDSGDKLWRGVSATFLTDVYVNEEDPFKLQGAVMRGVYDANGNLTKMTNLGDFVLDFEQDLPDTDNVWITISEEDPPPAPWDPEDGDYAKPGIPYLRHIGPNFDPEGEGYSIISAFSVSGDGEGGLTLEFSAYNILIDEVGHMNISSKTTDFSYDVDLGEILDVKVKASSTGAASGFLDEKLAGDETWVHVEFDSKVDQVVVSHIGPDAATATETDLGGAAYDDTKHTLTLGGVALEVDGTGHIYGPGTGASAVVLVGDGVWTKLIAGAGDNAGKVLLSHIGPTEASFETAPIYYMRETLFDESTLVYPTNALVFLGNKAAFDEKGHLYGVEPVGEGITAIRGDGKWIQLEVGDKSDFDHVITHIGPVTDEGIEEDPVIDDFGVVDDGGTKKIRLTSIDIAYDSCGHYLHKSSPATSTKDVTLTQVTYLTAVRVDTTNKKLQYKSNTGYLISPGTESGWTDYHTGQTC